MDIRKLVEEYGLTGSHYHYLKVCKTKLWYYHYNMIDNSENEFVKLGSQIDIQSYSRESSMSIGSSKIDFLKEKLEDGSLSLEVNEVKKTSKMEDANRSQLLHYMFLLTEKGSSVEGKLRFPKERKTKDITWCDETEKEHSENTKEIIEVIKGDVPEPIQKTVCSKCSMEEFCFSGDNL